VTEELSEEELRELELFEKMADARAEVEDHLKGREDFCSCSKNTKKGLIEVELCDDNVVLDVADIENLKRIIERHGFSVNRIEIDAWCDEVVRLTLRFYVSSL
jgi:hypothetical protein